MLPTAVDICFYHGNCHDGALAAAIIQRVSPAAVCVPAWWHALPKRAPDCTGKSVLFVDLMPCEEVLCAVQAVAAAVLVIDHHESAEPLLRLVPHVYDPGECGASLAWAWAFGSAVPYPPVVQYVRALDRFEWADLLPVDPDAIRVSRAIEQLVLPNPHAFAEALTAGELFMTHVRASAAIVERVVELQVDRAMASVEYLTLAGKDDTVVAVINSQHYANWISHRLHTTQPHVHITWVWYHNGRRESTCVSMRSDAKFDCARYAKTHGGGGHPNSAAFIVEDISDMWCHLAIHN